MPSDFDPTSMLSELFEPNPHVNILTDKIRQINEQLEEEGITEFDEDKRARLKDLVLQYTREWPHFGREVVFTGRIKVSFRQPDDKYSTNISAITEVREASRAVSLGFDIFQDEDEIYVGHVLGFDLSRAGQIVVPGSVRKPMYLGSAKIEDITLKDAQDEHNDVRDFLDKYHKDKTDILIDCILTAEDEVEILKNLGGVAFNMSKVKNPSELNEKLTEYISQEIIFNKLIPYSAIFKGPTLEVGVDGNVTDRFAFVDNWQSVACVPQRVEFLAALETDEEDQLIFSTTYSVPYLVMAAYQIDDLSGNRSVELAIPLSENLVLQSNIDNITPVKEPNSN